MEKGGGTHYPSPLLTRVKFDVAPDRASIFVDDNYLGRVGDYEGEEYDVAPGEHRIKIELHGYETFEETIALIPGQRFELKIRLARLSDKSKIATLSVLDRLIDLEPKRRSETLPTPAKSVRAVKEHLRRDLEFLMNTRLIEDNLPESFKELRRSVYFYGLSDINSMNLVTASGQHALLREVEACLALFEPRLARAKVSVKTKADSPHLVHFVIEGLLRIDPEPIPIRFDSFLELNNGTYRLRGDASA
jgi:type VI secretion system protein ImpF